MDDSLLSRAFDVGEIPTDFDPTKPPSNGLEYLQHVIKDEDLVTLLSRFEASKCPQVKVAEIDKRKIKNYLNINLELCNSVNSGYVAPSEDWQHHQIAIFSDLRRKVELSRNSSKFKPLPLPKFHDEDKWYNICFGDKNSRLEPLLTLMLSMNDRVLESVLEYHIEWLEDGLRLNQGKWLYALLACLSVPLTPVSCSLLRALARQCAEIRCSENSLKENDVTTLSLIICLVKKYFGQIDLPD